MINRVHLLERLASMRNGQAMVISPGLANYPIGNLADHPLTVYNMEMPYATPLALGMALGWPEKKVVAIEGDGSMLAGPGVLATVARYKVQNLVILVGDNGVYLTTGTGESPTGAGVGVDIAALGRVSGIAQAHAVDDLETATGLLRRALSEPGPWLIVAKVDQQDRAGTRRTPLPASVFESGMRFHRAALTERGLPIR